MEYGLTAFNRLLDINITFKKSSLFQKKTRNIIPRSNLFLFQDFINREKLNKATCGARVCADRQGISFVGFCSRDFLAGQSGGK